MGTTRYICILSDSLELTGEYSTIWYSCWSDFRGGFRHFDTISMTRLVICIPKWKKINGDRTARPKVQTYLNDSQLLQRYLLGLNRFLFEIREELVDFWASKHLYKLNLVYVWAKVWKKSCDDHFTTWKDRFVSNELIRIEVQTE